MSTGFSSGFNSSLSTMLGFGRLARNRIEEEEDKIKLEAGKLSLSELEQNQASGDASAIETGVYGEAIKSKYDGEVAKLTFETTERNSKLTNTKFDNMLLSDTFSYLLDVSRQVEAGNLERGSVAYDVALDIGANYMDQVADKSLDLYETISPAYVKALKSGSQALTLLQQGDSAGLEALISNSESLNTIFKPKTANYFGKEFVSSNGSFSGKIIDVNLNIADTVLSENGEATILPATFTVRNQEIYDKAIEENKNEAQAIALSTKTFNSFMPDITSDVITQTEDNRGDAVQVSVADMVDFAGSSIQLVSAILRDGNSEIFKFISEAKENSYRRANVLAPKDIADINERMLDIFAKSFDENRSAFLTGGGDDFLSSFKRNPKSKMTAQNLSKLVEILGPKSKEFTKFLVPHSDPDLKDDFFEWTGGPSESSIFNAFINTFPSKSDIRSDLMRGQNTEPNQFPQVPDTSSLTFFKGSESFDIQTTDTKKAFEELESVYGKDFLANEINTIRNVASARKIQLSEKEVLLLLQKSLR